jgi:hypothetical protein
LAESIKQNYGKDYAGVVLQAVIRNFLDKSSQKEQLREAISWSQNLANQGGIGPIDFERAKERMELNVRRILGWTGDRIDRSRSKQKLDLHIQGLRNNSAVERDYDAYGVKRGAPLYQRMMPRPKPSEEDINAVMRGTRQGGMSAEAFARKYGITRLQAETYKRTGKP